VSHPTSIIELGYLDSSQIRIAIIKWSMVRHEAHYANQLAKQSKRPSQPFFDVPLVVSVK
jgi:hypothetical protein